MATAQQRQPPPRLPIRRSPRSAMPGRRCNTLRGQLHWGWRWDFRSSPESWRVSALGYLKYQRFVAAIFVEILVQLKPQLPGVHSHGTIFQRTVIGRFMEQGVANVLLG